MNIDPNVIFFFLILSFSSNIKCLPDVYFSNGSSKIKIPFFIICNQIQLSFFSFVEKKFQLILRYKLYYITDNGLYNEIFKSVRFIEVYSIVNKYSKYQHAQFTYEIS